MLDVSKYFVDTYKNIRLFFVRINSNKFTTKFCCFLFFLFHIQYFCCYVHFYQFLLQIYSHENINQSDNLAHYIVFDFFIFVSTDCSLVKMTSHCLNPNLVLGLRPAVVLQSMVTLFAILLCKKILLGCFFWFNY